VLVLSVNIKKYLSNILLSRFCVSDSSITEIKIFYGRDLNVMHKMRFDQHSVHRNWNRRWNVIALNAFEHFS